MINPWGLIIAGLGAAVLYWAVKHSGSLADIAGLTALAGGAAAAKSVVAAPKSKGSGEDTTGESATGDAAVSEGVEGAGGAIADIGAAAGIGLGA